MFRKSVSLSVGIASSARQIISHNFASMLQDYNKVGKNVPVVLCFLKSVSFAATSSPQSAFRFSILHLCWETLYSSAIVQSLDLERGIKSWNTDSFLYGDVIFVPTHTHACALGACALSRPGA